MIDTDAGRTKVEINRILSVLVVRWLKHSLLPHLAGQGGEGEHQLVVPHAVVKTVQKIAAVSLKIVANCGLTVLTVSLSKVSTKEDCVS